jgi:NDP-sugar pyrophosphorylase family protein
MKAVLLAGGFGTRLRPLTLNTPKPVVPIFDRPFIYHQIDLLRQVPEIDEVILSLNYQPERIQDIVGHGENASLPIRYIVEPKPLGTGGAVKYAEPYLDGTTIVFNADVLTEIDLAAVVNYHRSNNAKATIVLTPVDNPSAYGLVETDSKGNVKRFLEKPNPNEITCNTINAGIYVLEPDSFDRIPTGTQYSIERRYFPSLIEQQDTFVAYINNGYWLDIGTPDKYLQGHRDILDGRCQSEQFPEPAGRNPTIAPSARLDAAARLEGPCFIGASSTVHSNAHITSYSVIGTGVIVDAEAAVHQSIIWPDCHIGQGACLDGAIVGHRCEVGAYAQLGPGVVLGDDSVITAHTKINGT